MTVRVNLLPHRAERRKRQRQHFFVLAGGTAVVGLLLVGAMHTFYQRQIDTQTDRNAFLKGEIAKLDKEIAEIDSQGRDRGAACPQAGDRDAAARSRTDGASARRAGAADAGGRYLSRIVQKGMRVSTLMRNVDASPWLERPVLIQVNAASVDKKRVSEFSMFLFLKRPVEVKPAAAPTPTAPAAAKK